MKIILGSSDIWSDSVLKKKTAEQFVYLNNHKQMLKMHCYKCIGEGVVCANIFSFFRSLQNWLFMSFIKATIFNRRPLQNFCKMYWYLAPLKNIIICWYSII